VKYTRADTHVKRHDALPLLEYVGHLAAAGRRCPAHISTTYCK